MECSNTAVSTPREVSFLESTIEQISIQNDQWEKTILYLKTEYISRLDRLACKLNSGDYPKNIPASQSGQDKEPPIPEYPSGLAGDLQRVININSQLRRLFEGLLGEIQVPITYLERHI